jgi:paraquat-inducible protein B
MNGNLLCANVDNMSGSLSIYRNGVATYDKLLGAYLQNNCQEDKNNNKTFQIQLTPSDYKAGTTENTSNVQYTSVQTKCSELRDNLNIYSDIINNASKKLSTNLSGAKYTIYETNKNTVINNYQSLVNKRSELDQKVKQLLGADNSVLYEKQNILDSAVFTTLLWTVLATSALYYAFTKI